jgi:CheY-like chemotaxis protein/anti-sigma regulatory factor (Ser/Thr protein kinase)
VKLQPEPVALGDAIKASIEMVGAFAAERSVALVIQPAGDPIKVTAVRDRTIQVMVNLISNAVKFSPRDTQVTVRWWRDEDSAIIEVVDQGVGIPAEKLELVFEPFTQLASSMTRDQGGAGLGLTISRGIVQALGGRIWAESVPGEGSHFYVRLPLAAEPVAAAPERVPPGPAGEVTVLVIHSDPDWQRLCAAAFRAEGWRVVSASSGAEGLAFLSGTRVDLVTVGLELSDVHGLAVVEQMRLDPLNCDVPTLIIGEGDVSHAVEYAADAWSSGDSLHLLDTARRLVTAPRRPAILFVEDDPAVRDSIRKVLRRSGYACITTADPRLAVEMLRIRRPALIMTDIRMPGIDGLTFLQQLRADPALADLPAIVLSGYVAPGVPEQVAALSARLLRKPVDLSELLAEIRALI